MELPMKILNLVKRNNPNFILEIKKKKSLTKTNGASLMSIITMTTWKLQEVGRSQIIKVRSCRVLYFPLLPRLLPFPIFSILDFKILTTTSNFIFPNPNLVGMFSLSPSLLPCLFVTLVHTFFFLFFFFVFFYFVQSIFTVV